MTKRELKTERRSNGVDASQKKLPKKQERQPNNLHPTHETTAHNPNSNNRNTHTPNSLIHPPSPLILTQTQSQRKKRSRSPVHTLIYHRTHASFPIRPCPQQTHNNTPAVTTTKRAIKTQQNQCRAPRPTHAFFSCKFPVCCSCIHREAVFFFARLSPGIPR
ncbi:hypothetical protein PUMCH_002901 [Australozyma saopauloensis]|uniref:Uncharacterized protein n=1 Tax=Australozyma saopauloensis TaxID=291208 RepID=A0AAX4HBA3_9ASCO|nr:hypothetical protein PUMCH_002901 [[Candida] saopauloensis]